MPIFFRYASWPVNRGDQKQQNPKQKTLRLTKENFTSSLRLHALLPSLLIRSRDATLFVPLCETMPLTFLRGYGLRFLRRRLRGKFLPGAEGQQRQQKPYPFSSSLDPSFSVAPFCELGAGLCLAGSASCAFLWCARCFPAAACLLSSCAAFACLMSVYSSDIIREGQPTERVHALPRCTRSGWQVAPPP